MVAVGLFLATLLWLGWDGGAVGANVVDALEARSGSPPTSFPSP